MKEQALVVFASLNQMNLVKRSFRKEGRYFDAIRTPKHISEGGCSHAIVCATGEAPEVMTRAAASDLTIRGAFIVRESSDGAVYQPFCESVMEEARAQ